MLREHNSTSLVHFLDFRSFWRELEEVKLCVFLEVLEMMASSGTFPTNQLQENWSIPALLPCNQSLPYICLVISPLNYYVYMIAHIVWSPFSMFILILFSLNRLLLSWCFSLLFFWKSRPCHGPFFVFFLFPCGLHPHAALLFFIFLLFLF